MKDEEIYNYLKDNLKVKLNTISSGALMVSLYLNNEAISEDVCYLDNEDSYF